MGVGEGSNFFQTEIVKYTLLPDGDVRAGYYSNQGVGKKVHVFAKRIVVPVIHL